MSVTDWVRVEALFHAAFAVPPAERGDHLDAACGGDRELRALLDSLLAAEPSADAALASVVTQATRELAADELPPPDLPRAVGPYRLECVIGAGGMGTVFLARRADGAFEQCVAVKLITDGLATPARRKAFVRERQALADLDHEHIARLLDGGTTADGQPYLVMEYVDGRPIDAWCDARRAGVDERLRLFAMVCDAVQHAHGSLIVHRDIKPANVLVTADGRPKLLDFGIAKILDPHGGETPTATAEKALTPEYASPEQLLGRRVTTASDVFSLGVLLYLLLSGRHPFAARGAPPHELARRVCDEEPRRPSTATAAAGADAAELAALRSTRPDRLRRRIAGDLDAIVLRALEKEPARRYESARQLAADVRRFLAGQPVLARRGSLVERAAKLARRHPAAAGAGGLVLALLIGGWIRTSNALAAERARAERLHSALQTTLDEFEHSDAHHRKLHGMLDYVASLARQMEFEGPQQEIAVLERIAEGYGRLRLPHPEITARILTLLDSAGERDDLRRATWLQRAGRLDEAWELRRRVLAPPHEDLAATLVARAARASAAGDRATAEDLFARARSQLEELGAPSTTRVRALREESLHSHRCGDNERAAALIDAAVEVARGVRPEDPLLVADVLQARGWLQQDRGRYEDAERDLGRALGLLEEHSIEGHPRLAQARLDHALLQKDTGRFEEAEQTLRRALAQQRWLFDPDDPEMLSVHLAFAKLFADWRRWEQAEWHARKAMALGAAARGENGLAVTEAETLLGRILLGSGGYAEARALLEHAHAIRSAEMPDARWERHKTASLLGEALVHAGELDRAEALLLESVPKVAADRGPDHYRTAQAYQRLVALYRARGRPAEAARWAAMITAEARRHRIVGGR